MHQRCKKAHGEIERAATIIADQVQRHHRSRICPDGMERTRYGDVVDIVAGGMGERTGLPPPVMRP